MTASTLTTVAVFAPIALVGGFVGQLFAPFAITVTVALLASLLVSLTVIPVLAYWFLKPVGGRGRSSIGAGRGRGEGAAQPVAARLPARDPVRHQAAVDHGRDRPRGAGRHARPGRAGWRPTSSTSRVRTRSASPRRCRSAPVSPPQTRPPRRSRASSKNTPDVESYQVTIGGDAMSVALRRRRRQQRQLLASRSRRATTPSGVGDLLRDKLGRLDGAGEITVGSDSGGGIDANELRWS